MLVILLMLATVTNSVWLDPANTLSSTQQKQHDLTRHNNPEKNQKKKELSSLVVKHVKQLLYNKTSSTQEQQSDPHLPPSLTRAQKLEKLNVMCPEYEETCLRDAECKGALFQLLDMDQSNWESVSNITGYIKAKEVFDHCRSEVQEIENKEDTYMDLLEKTQNKEELSNLLTKDDKNIMYDQTTDAFTLIFISDLEVVYRGHTENNAERLIGSIKNLYKKNLYFKDGMKIDPKIVLHGGDNTDIVYGNENDAGFAKIWQQLYDAGIPMVSGMGNHDFSYAAPSVEGKSTRWWNNHRFNKKIGQEFVAKSIVKASKLGVKLLSYQLPKYDYGPTFYNLEFRGLQIPLFSLGPYSPSYDSSDDQITDPGVEQYNEFIKQVNRTKPSLITGHYQWPVFVGGQTSDHNLYEDNFGQFLSSFPAGSAYFNGHAHREHRPTSYASLIWSLDSKDMAHREHRSTFYGGHEIKSYTAPYPWPLPAGDGHIAYHGGYFAVQVSPTKGIIEVKTIQSEYWCKSKGELCGLGTTCNDCCETIGESNQAYWYSKAMTACGKEPCWGDGSHCGLGTTCNACCNANTYWYSKAMTACGEEPCWGDGWNCGRGTTCKACCNDNTYWHSKAMTACGREPCWSSGWRCFKGTSCDICCNGSRWSWKHFFTVCK